VPNLLADLPTDLPLVPIVITAGVLHCAIGIVAAFVAQRKGRQLGIWLPIGLIAGTPALIAAWRLKPEIIAKLDKFDE
jgi:hypothetical protein